MIKKIISKIDNNFKFLIIVIGIFLLCSAFRNDLFMPILVNFIDLTIKTVPTLIIIFFLMFISNIFLDTKKIIKYFGEESGKSGVALSVIFGILSAGPIYMWYPLLSDLKEKGMRDSLIATFLYNRAIKIPLIPMMIYYFGTEFVLVLSLYMIIFSVINGFLVEKSLTPKI